VIWRFGSIGLRGYNRMRAGNVSCEAGDPLVTSGVNLTENHRFEFPHFAANVDLRRMAEGCGHKPLSEPHARTAARRSTAISLRVSKAAQRDGSRPLPLLDVDRLGHRPVSLLMLGSVRLQLPHNAMTKLGQDVVHFSHHFPSPSSFTNEASAYLELTPHAVTPSQFGGPALMKVSTSTTISLSAAT
jgi:hypothetical protein